MSFQIFDGTSQNQDSLLFDSRDADPSHEPRFARPQRRCCGPDLDHRLCDEAIV